MHRYYNGAMSMPDNALIGTMEGVGPSRAYRSFTDIPAEQGLNPNFNPNRFHIPKKHLRAKKALGPNKSNGFHSYFQEMPNQTVKRGKSKWVSQLSQEHPSNPFPRGVVWNKKTIVSEADSHIKGSTRISGGMTETQGISSSGVLSGNPLLEVVNRAMTLSCSENGNNSGNESMYEVSSDEEIHEESYASWVANSLDEFDDLGKYHSSERRPPDSSPSLPTIVPRGEGKEGAKVTS